MNHATIRHTCSGILIATLLAGCLPERPTYIEELDLVYTNFDPGFAFAQQHTYALPDSVVRLTDGLAEGEAPEMINALYGDRIVRRLKDNMNANGWTLVAADEDPDVVLLPVATTSTTVDFNYGWGYWGWYYPGWYGGWGWYYPGYYPTYVESYKTGTLLVQMTWPEGIGENDYVPVEWVLVVDGLLEGSTAGLLERIDKNIDQGFTQSAYLKIQ